MKRPSWIALAACFLIAADAPQPPSDKLEGRWFGGVRTFNGAECHVVDFKNPLQTFDFTNNTAIWRSRSGETKRWSYTLIDDTDPKAIDMTILEGPDEGKTLKGVYAIKPNISKGYDLTICVAKSGEARPKIVTRKHEEGIEVHDFVRYPIVRQDSPSP